MGYRLALALSTVLLLTACSEAQLDLSNPIIPPGEILDGGPGKDGIPAILRPRFARAGSATHVRDDDIVMGYVAGGEARAYPLSILVWHEIVNDTVGGQPVVVTYCPLCGTGMVFDRRVKGRALTFGVSGLLYQSDVLMYDHQSESLWSQVMSKAVTGRMSGSELRWLPSEQMTWRAWRALYPDSEVLVPSERSQRARGRTPYGSYHQSPGTMFPVPHFRDDLPLKEWILGVVVNGAAKAYPIELLSRAGQAEDIVGGRRVKVAYDAVSRRAVVTDARTGRPIPSVQAYWFAWQAFHPETEVAR